MDWPDDGGPPPGYKSFLAIGAEICGRTKGNAADTTSGAFAWAARGKMVQSSAV
ncbi:MAG TPA: hypothetical protein VEJ37_07415 [Xanthobacteraceae bacterium]|nr:hypothetical protein [Xanthobacteraceae bacterium]